MFKDKKVIGIIIALVLAAIGAFTGQDIKSYVCSTPPVSGSP